MRSHALDDLNKKISALRGYREPPKHCCGMSGFGYSLDDVCPACDEPEVTRFDRDAREEKFREKENRDWLRDENWPTLLREMQKTNDFILKIDEYGISIYEPGYVQGILYTGEDIGEAVCSAWLKWKEK